MNPGLEVLLPFLACRLLSPLIIQIFLLCFRVIPTLDLYILSHCFFSSPWVGSLLTWYWPTFSIQVIQQRKKKKTDVLMCLPEMSLLMHDLRPHCPRQFICLQRLVMLQKEYKCKVVAVKNRTSQQNNSLGKPVYYVVKDCCLLSLFSSGSLVLPALGIGRKSSSSA